MASGPPLIGIVGWKNSGKTTLIERLVAALTQRGLRVATVKHTHHELRATMALPTANGTHRPAPFKQR
ncbi:MAG: molybdopterin-guanine dinucleotide biosynthesis protein B [Hyphomicrobium sp.]